MVGGFPPPNTPWDPKMVKKIMGPNFKTRFDHKIAKKWP